MNLSMNFDTIKHDLLIAKLLAYSFNKESLNLLHNYLSNRWHRAKIKKNLIYCKSWFKECRKDLFLQLGESSKVCKFTDVTTFHTYDKNISYLVTRLEHVSYPANEWFKNSSIKLNY